MCLRGKLDAEIQQPNQPMQNEVGKSFGSQFRVNLRHQRYTTESIQSRSEPDLGTISKHNSITLCGAFLECTSSTQLERHTQEEKQLQTNFCQHTVLFSWIAKLFLFQAWCYNSYENALSVSSSFLCIFWLGFIIMGPFLENNNQYQKQWSWSSCCEKIVF